MEIVIVVGIVAVSLALAFLAYQSMTGGAWWIGRRFAKLPLATVAAAAPPGVYRLSGHARPLDADPPVSEASGRQFLAQDLRIRASDGSGPGGNRGAQRAVDFLLDDGTGVALVRAAGGRVTLERDFSPPRTTLDTVPWVDELLRAGGYHNGSPATCKVTLWEGVLAPGDRAGVIGYVEPADAEARALGATAVVRPADGSAVMVRSEAGARRAAEEGAAA